MVRAAGLEPERSEPLAPLIRVARHLDATRPAEARRSPLDRPTRPLDELLDWISLHSEQDLPDPRAERISLMTLHASKGLEWPVVIIAGCEDGLIPYRRPGKATDLDEERRLFFVGMTRARDLLVLSRAEERTLYGERSIREPSPFLRDIEERYTRLEAGAPAKRETPLPSKEQLDLF
jgi:DNA helicase-2/ATP-dependent DNA helicase PcrA